MTYSHERFKIEVYMICFLTSRMDDPKKDKLNTANSFLRDLRKCFPFCCKGLCICSNPNDWNTTDYYAGIMKGWFEKARLRFESFKVLDGRNYNLAKSLIEESDLIILSGGHVHTKNDFFQLINLRNLLKNYKGIIVGISAGSMNSADTVYSQPEEEGEAIDPTYKRFLTGLNLTKTMLLPHYQDIKNNTLDGFRVFEDIAYSDSIGKTFYAIPDGSYLYIDLKKEELRGEAYMIKDGILTQISKKGEVVKL